MGVLILIRLISMLASHFLFHLAIIISKLECHNSKPHNTLHNNKQKKDSMTTETEALVAKLKELNLNLEFIKKTINRDDCKGKGI